MTGTLGMAGATTETSTSPKRDRVPRRRSSRVVLLAVLLACAAMLAACGGSSDTADTAKDTSEVSLKVGVISPGSSARQVNRMKSGAFDGTEYSVEWVEFATTNDALPALISGAIDIALLVQSPNAVLAAGNATEPWTAETAPFVIIGAALPYVEDGQLVIVKTDSPIQSLDDLRGKSITFPRGSLQQYCWAKLRLSNNLPAGAVNEVLMAAGEARAAYLSGAIEANVANSWARSQIVAGKSRSIATCEPSVAPEYTVTLARAGLLDDQATAAAVSDLLERSQTAEAWWNDNRDEAAKTYVEVASQSDAEAAASAKYDNRVRVPLDAETIAAIQDEADVFAELGVMRTRPDVAFLFDTRFDDGLTRGR